MCKVIVSFMMMCFLSRYFNIMEDLKGKIRVYARVRPMLNMETKSGQSFALGIPDELTLSHFWREVLCMSFVCTW